MLSLCHLTCCHFIVIRVCFKSKGLFLCDIGVKHSFKNCKSVVKISNFVIMWDILDIAVDCSYFLNSFFSWIWKCNNLMETYCFLICTYKKKKLTRVQRFLVLMSAGWVWVPRGGSHRSSKDSPWLCAEQKSTTCQRRWKWKYGIASVTECSRQSDWDTWKEKEMECCFHLGFYV